MGSARRRDARGGGQGEGGEGARTARRGSAPWRCAEREGGAPRTGGCRADVAGLPLRIRSRRVCEGRLASRHDDFFCHEYSVWKKRESPHFPATRLAESLARPPSAPQFDRDFTVVPRERASRPPAPLPAPFSSLTTSTMASQVRLPPPRARGAVSPSRIRSRPNPSRLAAAARRARAAPRRAASISRRVRNAHARGSMTREAASDARSRLTRAPSRRPRPSPRRFSLSTRPCWPRYASARRDVAPRARSNPPSRVESVARRAEPPGKTTRGGFLTRQRGGVRIGFPAMPGARVRRAIAPLATPTLTFPPPPSVPDPPPPPFPRLPSPPTRAAPLA